MRWQHAYTGSDLNQTNRPNAAYYPGIVILAAGASRRMGRPKLVLPWGGRSLLGHQIATWKELLARQIAVVCGAGHGPIWAELDRLQFPGQDRILNPHPEAGMFSSIRCAAQWPNWR